MQLLLCSALNLKRIVAHAGEAATGAAAGPRTVKAEAVEASGEASTRSAGVSWHRITLTAGAGAANTHIIAPAWTIGLLVIVAELLGHARLETTRGYTRPSAEDRTRALDLLPVDK